MTTLEKAMQFERNMRKAKKRRRIRYWARLLGRLFFEVTYESFRGDPKATCRITMA